MRAFVVFGLLVSIGTEANASETITYTYDALGRLVTVTRSGTVNNGASGIYTYDRANNRTNVTTTAPTGGGGLAQTRSQPAEKRDKAMQRSGAANGAPHE